MDAQPAIRHNLLSQPTSFIGREVEIAEIAALLDDPSCRLLTLVGPGGIGKTRLALKVAEQVQPLFADGVYAVPLQPITSFESLLPTIASVLKISFYGGVSPQKQLLNFLQDKQLLLLLDNFEHVLEAADLLHEIVLAAPEVKVLVTSRASLNSHSEWLFHVEGLSVPRNDDHIRVYSAVQLFVERARQVRRDFSLASEHDSVLKICRLVEGIPLALELAAAWLRRISCTAIAAEIERNLGFLITDLRDVPNRHRSMRAVFTYSWQLLQQETRVILMKLSVFRGGFTREAAEVIAGASLFHLSGLVDQSLVRLNTDGRYDMHELLRQYAEEKLNEVSDVREKALDKHCSYYLDFITGNPAGPAEVWIPREGLQGIYIENANIQKAWAHAIDTQRFDFIRTAYIPLGFYYTWIRYAEAEHLFLQMIQWLKSDQPQGEQGKALGFMLNSYAYCLPGKGEYELAFEYHEEGMYILRSLNAKQELLYSLIWSCETLFKSCDFDQGLKHAQEAYSIADSIEDYVTKGEALNCIAHIERMAGHYQKAQDSMEASLEPFKQCGYLSAYMASCGCLAEFAQKRGEYLIAQQMMDKARPLMRDSDRIWNIGVLYEYIGHIEHALGNYTLAEENLLESLRIARSHGDPTVITYSLDGLGDLYCGMEDFEKAQQVYQQAIDVAKPTFQRWQEAWALRGLGQVAYSTGNHQQAKQYIEQSMELCDQIGWKDGLVQAHNVLGLSAVAQKNEVDARTYFYKSFSSGLVTETPPFILTTVYGSAWLFSIEGHIDRAVELLNLILRHPASHADTRNVAQNLLGKLKSMLPKDLFDAACKRGEMLELETVVQDLLELFKPNGEVNIKDLAFPRHIIVANELLSEPLTERELEILQLIAGGLSNQDIADHLVVSKNTIKKHINNLYSKIRVSSRTQAIRCATELGLV